MDQDRLSPSPSFCSGSTILSEVIVNEKINLALNYLRDYEKRLLSKYKDLIRLQAENRPTFPSGNPGEETGSTVREKLRGLIMMKKAPTNGSLKDLQTTNLNPQNATAKKIKIIEVRVELLEVKIDMKDLEQMMDQIMDDKLVTIEYIDDAPPLSEDEIKEFEKTAGSFLLKWEGREKNTTNE